jgi:Tfp pilus assembly protein PilX
MRRWSGTLRSWLAARCKDEQGIALILVLIIMFSLSIMLVTVISYSDSTQEASFTNVKRNAASNLAEAGLNDAYSVISQIGTDDTAIPAPPTFPSGPNTAPVGGNQTTFAGGGIEAWGGSYDSTTKTWTITSYGLYPSPTGNGTYVTRRLGAAVQIVAPPYTFASLASTCEKHSLVITLGGNLTVTNGIYVNSCDSGHDAFDVKGSAASIAAPTINVVGGWETGSGNLVKVNGITCSLSNDNPPDPSPPAGCPTVGAPVITDPYATKLSAPALGSPMCQQSTYGASASYAGKPKLTAAITAAQTTLTTGLVGPANGDIIQIDTENMLVTAGGGTTSLTVQRAYNGTTAAAHSSGKEVKYLPFTGYIGTAAAPAPCDIYSGTVTLNPGTYYGGICIGTTSGKDCGPNINGVCPTTASGPANVTMNPGTYIMAGGGFFVCGNSTLSAPNVLIYNTNDPSHTAGSGAVDQILLNTTGAVTLGPQSHGAYQGLTIFQDRTQTVDTTDSCDSKKAIVADQDIAFESVASSGVNGQLGSISGTIYAPGLKADFADYLSGTGNLAVLTACMVIAGGDATFNFQANGLFGTGDSMKILSQY